MSEYSCETRVPSCSVSKDTLERIEQYMHERAKALGLSQKQIASSYAITVVGSIGEEKFKSVEDLPWSRFPNDTKDVRVELSTYSPRRLSVRITFSTGRLHSLMGVYYSGDSAREVALGILHALKNILAPCNNMNSWFHLPTPLHETLVLGGLAALFWAAVSLAAKRVNEAAVLAKIGAPMLMYALCGWLKPYSQFETKRNESRTKWANWLFFGILAFLVFSVAGVFLRKRLLGF